MRGDFAVVRTPGPIGAIIRIVTRSDFNHAYTDMGDGTIIEARARGAVRTQDTYPARWRMVSHMPLTDDQRNRICDNAIAVLGTPYGFLDLLSLGLLQYGIRWKWIRDRVARQDRLVCSQLEDLIYERAGIHLYNDGRPSMDVTPGDLADLIHP